MYDHEKLIDLVDSYMIDCKGHVTRQGLADYLGISHQTITNVINGRFNGFIYTPKPHINRIVDNKDFYIIRQIFEPEKGKYEDNNSKDKWKRDD